jgi:hypothetical protein
MHPTANSAAFIRKTWVLDALNARRVMPGVGRLLVREILSAESEAAVCQWM